MLASDCILPVMPTDQLVAQPSNTDSETSSLPPHIVSRMTPPASRQVSDAVAAAVHICPVQKSGSRQTLTRRPAALRHIQHHPRKIARCPTISPTIGAAWPITAAETCSASERPCSGSCAYIASTLVPCVAAVSRSRAKPGWAIKLSQMLSSHCKNRSSPPLLLAPWKRLDFGKVGKGNPRGARRMASVPS